MSNPVLTAATIKRLTHLEKVMRDWPTHTSHYKDARDSHDNLLENVADALDWQDHLAWTLLAWSDDYRDHPDMPASLTPSLMRKCADQLGFDSVGTARNLLGRFGMSFHTAWDDN